jgi:hypothetical protein
MKYAFAIVYLLLLNTWMLPVMAQDKPSHPPAESTLPTAPAAAAAPNAPLQQSIPIPPARALAIRDAQVEALNAQQQLQQLLQARDEAQRKMQDAIRAAYAEAKLKDTEYTIDDRRWVFLPTPKTPTSPTPTPAAGAKK